MEMDVFFCFPSNHFSEKALRSKVQTALNLVLPFQESFTSDQQLISPGTHILKHSSQIWGRVWL